MLSTNTKSIAQQNLDINEAKDKHFVVKGAREVHVNDIREVLELIQLGERNRSYAETQLNH